MNTHVSPVVSFRGFLARLRDDQSGSAAVLAAISMVALLASASVAVDLGSIYLAKRKLQGIADAAAMAAVEEDTTDLARKAAQQAIEHNTDQPVEIAALTQGSYTRDASVPVDDRFSATGGDINAAKVELTQRVPTFFAQAIGFDGATVRADAIASKTDMAAYSLGTALLKISGGIPNKLLSALIGTDLNLSAVDSQSIASTQLDVLGFANALKAQVGGKDDLTYGELFGQEIPVDQVIAAMSKVAGTGAGGILDRIAYNATGDTVKMSDLIDLGPYASLDYAPTSAGITVNAYSLLRGALELSHGDHYDVSFGLTVTGLSNVTARLVGGRGMVHSPMLTITAARDYVLRTSAARLLLTASVGTGSTLLPSVTIPVYAELADAQAQLTDIECLGNVDTDGVTLSVTPSVGTVALGTPQEAGIDDFSQAVTIDPATLLNVPLIAKVTGYAKIDLGGMTSQSVLFTKADIAKLTTKTVSTNDVVAGVASSLVKQTDLQVSALGLTTNASAVTSLVGNALSVAAPLLDTTVSSVLEAAGAKVGAADVRVDRMKCGMPVVIA